jgi:GT2 family glycosyltransferase
LKIAVVIVNYNSEDLLAKCINHLLDQSRQADVIMVVDNGSHDRSMANLPRCSTLRVHELETNQGFASANNFAFRQIEDADYFITLNPDAFPKPDFIERFEEAARDHPEYASFASRMMRDENTVDGAGDVYHISGIAWRSLYNQRYFSDRHQPCDVFAPCAGAAMYKANDLIEAGGFDDSFFCYMEDVDLGYRLQLKGRRCLYVPQATVIHLGSAITGKYPDFALYYGHRNLVWTLVKNTPAPLLPLIIPAHLLMTVVVGIVFLARGKFKPYLQAKIDAIRGLGRVLRQRKQVQNTRQISSWKILRLYNLRLKKY